MKIFFILLALIIFLLLFLCLYFWPYFIATKKQKDEHLAIFIVCLVLPLFPLLGWIASLMWAISLPDYRSIEEKEQQKNARNALWDFIAKNWVATLLFSIIAALIITFGIVNEPWYKENQESQIIERAIKKYQKEQIIERAKEFEVSKKCAEAYENTLKNEGVIEGDVNNCTQDENKKIKDYQKKLEEEYSKRGYYLDENEPRWGNAGMPKSLVLKGVSIMCFEKANMHDDNWCTKNQIETIDKFFKENPNINWQKESFNYLD